MSKGIHNISLSDRLSVPLPPPLYAAISYMLRDPQCELLMVYEDILEQ